MIRLTHGHYLSPIGATRDAASARLIETTYTPGMRLPRHSHQFPYMVLMLDGVLNETSRGRTHELSSGWMVFNDAAECHENEIRVPRTRCLNVELSPSILERLDSEGLRSPERVLYTHAGHAVGAIGRLYAAAIDPGPEIEVEESLVEILAVAWRSAPTRDEAPWVRRVVELLHARFRESLSLHQIAGEVGITHVHLCRGFKQARGCTIGEYIRALRVQWALSEITKDEASLAAIAVRAGFSDQAHMTRTISRALGRSPGRLRRCASRICRSRSF